jgi:hypothetical protein
MTNSFRQFSDLMIVEYMFVQVCGDQELCQHIDKDYKGNITMPKLLTSVYLLHLFHMGESDYLFCLHIYLISLVRSCREDFACYPHDILYHIFTSLLVNNASSIAYFTWGRVV